MIYTVTFNPSLDYIVSVEDFTLGLTNRTSSELMLPGGKGLNVSMVLGNLGIANTALGFSAGFTGAEIIRRVEEMGVHTDFIALERGISRINLKLKSIDGTEINGCGPEISEDAVEELMKKLDRLQEEDVLVLAGSIPNTMPDDSYSRMMKRLEQQNVRVVVDATKDLLVNVLAYHPFLVKPNNYELGEIFGTDLKSREDVIPYAKKNERNGSCKCSGFHGERRGRISCGGRKHLRSTGSERNACQRRWRRRFHGCGIFSGMAGKACIQPCILHGVIRRKRQCIFRSFGNQTRN